jgi:hypothetical protein
MDSARDIYTAQTPSSTPAGAAGKTPQEDMSLAALAATAVPGAQAGRAPQKPEQEVQAAASGGSAAAEAAPTSKRPIEALEPLAAEEEMSNKVCSQIVLSMLCCADVWLWPRVVGSWDATLLGLNTRGCVLARLGRCRGLCRAEGAGNES